MSAADTEFFDPMSVDPPEGEAESEPAKDDDGTGIELEEIFDNPQTPASAKKAVAVAVDESEDADSELTLEDEDTKEKLVKIDASGPASATHRRSLPAETKSKPNPKKRRADQDSSELRKKSNQTWSTTAAAISFDTFGQTRVTSNFGGSSASSKKSEDDDEDDGRDNQNEDDLNGTTTFNMINASAAGLEGGFFDPFAVVPNSRVRISDASELKSKRDDVAWRTKTGDDSADDSKGVTSDGLVITYHNTSSSASGGKAKDETPTGMITIRDPNSRFSRTVMTSVIEAAMGADFYKSLPVEDRGPGDEPIKIPHFGNVGAGEAVPATGPSLQYLPGLESSMSNLSMMNKPTPREIQIMEPSDVAEWEHAAGTANRRWVDINAS